MSVEPPLMKDVLNGVLNQRVDASGLFSAFPNTQMTPAEFAVFISTGTNPVVSFAYPPGDLRRYGADTTGTTDSTVALQQAMLTFGGGTGVVTHPGGTIMFGTSIAVPNGITIEGYDRNACIFNYTDTHQAFTNTNGPNSSGFGKVNFYRLKITTANGSNTGAAIELNAGGFAFYEIAECWLTGTFKWGVILDGTEVCHVHNNIIDNNSGAASGANVWIVNGADRVGGQGTGFTNNIHICDNQCNISGTTSRNIVDDGGSNHWIRNNNLNGGAMMAVFAGCSQTLDFADNEMENAGFQDGASSANVLFSNTTNYTAANVGACLGGNITGNAFSADYQSGSTLAFAGATMHQGFRIHGNYFRANLGRAADIDVTSLSNSVVGPNYSLNTTAQHYGGVHNDTNGNTLYPPQLGYTGGFAEGAFVHGDTRYPHQFFGNFSLKTAKCQSFILEVINVGGVIQHSITNQSTLGSTAAYADRISGASATRNNTPTVGVGTGFTAGGGLTANVFVLNTADQVSTEGVLHGVIEYYDGNAQRVRVYVGNNSRNINGVTQDRPELVFTDDMTGAASNLNTTLLPANKSIRVALIGFIT